MVTVSARRQNRRIYICISLIDISLDRLSSLGDFIFPFLNQHKEICSLHVRHLMCHIYEFHITFLDSHSAKIFLQEDSFVVGLHQFLVYDDREE